jgi:hypothetical protein
MKGKGERGNSDRGLWGKRKGAGGFGQKAFFLLWLAPRSDAGEGPGRRRQGEKEEGDEGVLLPHSPWVEAARGDGSTGGGGPVVVVLGGGGTLVLRQGEDVTVVRCGSLGSGRPLL